MHLLNLNNYQNFFGILIFARKFTLEFGNIPSTLKDYEERYLANETDKCTGYRDRRCNDLSCEFTSRFDDCLCMPGFSGPYENNGSKCRFINPKQTLTVEIAMEISLQNISAQIPYSFLLFWAQRQNIRHIYGAPRSWPNYVSISIRIHDYWYCFFLFL